ncbi:MAG: hypothetical protein J2P17_01295 [Mycobacterium sp.]|nr:hypothetical protein [Mycobacterium sp.]
MNTPVRSEDEDARKLALAPKNSPGYLQHSDGSWSFVGDDGWPVSPDEFCADLVSEYGIAAIGRGVVDVDSAAVPRIESERRMPLTELSEGTPMDDIDDDYDEPAQNDPAWMDWAAPDRLERQIDRLFTQTLPSLPREPWWTARGLVRAGGDVVEPMPDCGRYDKEMLWWVEEAVDYWFPDEDAVSDPKLHDIADQFVAYFGEVLRARVGGQWHNECEQGDPLYEFGPAIAFDFTLDRENVVDLLIDLADGRDGAVSDLITVLNSDKRFIESHTV